MEKPLKEQNRKKCTFNMQKEWFNNWYLFNYLITKDERIKTANLQKPTQFRSFIIRGLIQNYIRVNIKKYNEKEYLEWRIKFIQDATNKNKNQKKNKNTN